MGAGKSLWILALGREQGRVQPPTGERKVRARTRFDGQGVSDVGGFTLLLGALEQCQNLVG